MFLVIRNNLHFSSLMAFREKYNQIMQVINTLFSHYKHDLAGHDRHTPSKKQILLMTAMILVALKEEHRCRYTSCNCTEYGRGALGLKTYLLRVMILYS